MDAAPRRGAHSGMQWVTWEKNYRFSETSGIHHLCGAVRQGEADQAVRLLRAQSHPDLIFV